MHQAVRVFELLNIVAFTGLALLVLREWLLRGRHAVVLWAALAFMTLSVVTIVGRIVPVHPSELVAHTVVRLDIAVLLVFPYLLYRFTATFDPPSLRVTRTFNALTVVLVVATFALPRFPEQGEAWSTGFVLYVVAFLLHWVLLSTVAATRLWRGGRGQPSVARRRMRLLAAGAAGLTIALFAAVFAGDNDAVRLATQVLALLTSFLFALGIAPPRLLRMAWRRPEQQRLSRAIEDLMTLATTREQVVERVLGPMAAIVGARAVELRDETGMLLGSYEQPARPAERTERISVEVPGGVVEVWTTPFAPFFGDAELELLRTLGALTGIALDRVRLFVQEHESRLALQRANDVMANFVALAAHELRTPVTTIHGFVHTLNHLGDRLSEEQRETLRETLEEQTLRMASLVEQLLDLSRLDADAVEIAPQRFRVRDRLTDLVGTVAADRAGKVTVDVDDELEADADPQAFDRIVTNLITNAFRYGEPPVIVRAQHEDDHFFVAVEDRGAGVSPEFVPNLFERFSRSDGGRARAVGTGLGLAIARSYARAHGGDLVYRPAQPHGARFELVLPAA